MNDLSVVQYEAYISVLHYAFTRFVTYSENESYYWYFREIILNSSLAAALQSQLRHR
jgi:hypothetical protein